MIDHVSIRVSNLEKSISFYQAALAPLGYKRLNGDFGGAIAFATNDSDKTYGTVWLIAQGPSEPLTQNIHIGFVAKDIEMVNSFYDAAMKAGAVNNGRPGICPEYSNDYYGGFVLDPDGNNVEAKVITKE